LHSVRHLLGHGHLRPLGRWQPHGRRSGGGAAAAV